MMNKNFHPVIQVMIVLAAVWSSTRVVADQPVARPTNDMPAKDRKTIDEHLGKGAVGKPVPADVIDDPMEYEQFKKDGIFRVQMTCGDQKGQFVPHSIKKETGPSGKEQWRATAGVADVLVFGQNDRGEMCFLEHAEPAKGLTGIYNPPPPLLVKGMKPGSTIDFNFDVKIVKLDNPKDVKHEGKLKLKLSYLGMFEIKTPSGNYNAALIKSEYIGKIGPAKVDDSQYRFFAKGVGVVGMVEFKDLSAFLVYNETLKVGKLLAKQK
jgi:hypothetical protein